MDLAQPDSDDSSSLAMLEQRLQRLEFLLHGRSDAFGAAEPIDVPATPDECVTARIERLDKGLQRLTARYEAARGVLDLYGRYPELFTPAAEERVPSTLDESVITSMVLAHASAFSETLARLNVVKELPIPPASLSAELVEVRPRLDKVREEQEEQLERIAELRVSSARLLELWLEAGVVGQGEVWTEYEERVRAVERVVRRIEVARTKEKREI